MEQAGPSKNSKGRQPDEYKESDESLSMEDSNNSEDHDDSEHSRTENCTDGSESSSDNSKEIVNVNPKLKKHIPKTRAFATVTGTLTKLRKKIMNRQVPLHLKRIGRRSGGSRDLRMELRETKRRIKVVERENEERIQKQYEELRVKYSITIPREPAPRARKRLKGRCLSKEFDEEKRPRKN